MDNCIEKLSLNIFLTNDELFELELSEWQKRAVVTILGLSVKPKENFYSISEFTDEMVYENTLILEKKILK